MVQVSETDAISARYDDEEDIAALWDCLSQHDPDAARIARIAAVIAALDERTKADVVLRWGRWLFSSEDSPLGDYTALPALCAATAACSALLSGDLPAAWSYGEAADAALLDYEEPGGAPQTASFAAALFVSDAAVPGVWQVMTVVAQACYVALEVGIDDGSMQKAVAQMRNAFVEILGRVAGEGVPASGSPCRRVLRALVLQLRKLRQAAGAGQRCGDCGGSFGT